MRRLYHREWNWLCVSQHPWQRTRDHGVWHLTSTAHSVHKYVPKSTSFYKISNSEPNKYTNMNPFYMWKPLNQPPSSCYITCSLCARQRDRIHNGKKTWGTSGVIMHGLNETGFHIDRQTHSLYLFSNSCIWTGLSCCGILACSNKSLIKQNFKEISMRQVLYLSTHVLGVKKP